MQSWEQTHTGCRLIILNCVDQDNAQELVWEQYERKIRMEMEGVSVVSNLMIE